MFGELSMGVWSLKLLSEVDWVRLMRERREDVFYTQLFEPH